MMDHLYEVAEEAYIGHFEIGAEDDLTALKRAVNAVVAALAAMPQPDPVAQGQIEIVEVDAKGTRGVTSITPNDWWFKLPAGHYRIIAVPLYASPPRDDRDAEIERLRAKLAKAVEALNAPATLMIEANSGRGKVIINFDKLSDADRFVSALAEIKAGDA